MHLPEKAIDEFREAWFAHYGERLSAGKARLIAERFLRGVYDMMLVRPSDGVAPSLENLDDEDEAPRLAK